MSTTARNVVFSNFVSARSMRRGLAKLGHALFAHEAPGFLVPPLDDGPRPGDRLFFTDESALAKYLGNDLYQFHPRRVNLPLDDKLAFVDVVRKAGGDPVRGLPLERIEELRDFPIILKGRHSWRNGRPHPRGTVCASSAEVRTAVAAFAAQGFPAEGFFLQQWLPDGITNCWSVSGWHDAADADRNVLAVTRKLAATSGGLGYALLVGTMDESHGLRERTLRLLRALDYTGPFELEFLQDPRLGTFHELELNPRFWLQHSIFIEASDNLLLRRYIGDTTGKPQLPDAPPGVLWVSGVGLLTTLARLHRRESRAVLGTIWQWRRRGSRILLDPPVPVAVQLLFADLRRRLGRLLGRH